MISPGTPRIQSKSGTMWVPPFPAQLSPEPAHSRTRTDALGPVGGIAEPSSAHNKALRCALTPACNGCKTGSVDSR